jgi:hypothetical protein
MRFGDEALQHAVLYTGSDDVTLHVHDAITLSTRVDSIPVLGVNVLKNAPGADEN